MNFATKLIISVITIAGTIVASIWTGFEKIDSRMDNKVNEAKVEVYSRLSEVKEDNKVLLKAQDDKVAVQLVAITNDIGEVRKDVRSLLGIARKSQVFMYKRPNYYYTDSKTKKGNNYGQL